MEYDWQLILDFIYLLPTHSYIYETVWLIDALTHWLFNIMKTENVVKTDKRKKTESMIILKQVANEYHKYISHRYNIHFMLDCDDTCRKYYENAIKNSYTDYKRINSSLKRQTLDVYCILAREPYFSLYYPTEKTIPQRFKVKT